MEITTAYYENRTKQRNILLIKCSFEILNGAPHTVTTSLEKVKITTVLDVTPCSLIRYLPNNTASHLVTKKNICLTSSIQKN